MSIILGHLIVITALSIVVFFSARTVLRQLKSELSGHGTCAGCAGCTGSSGERSCTGCSACTPAGTQNHAPQRD